MRRARYSGVITARLMSVSIPPGAIALTVTPCWPNSWAIARVNASTAPFGRVGGEAAGAHGGAHELGREVDDAPVARRHAIDHRAHQVAVRDVGVDRLGAPPERLD